jgi:hypothetical protein
MDWHTRFRTSFVAAALSASALVFFSGSVFGDDAPASDDRMWHISTLITGNTAQVREAVNGPLEQQLVRKADKENHYKEVKADLDQKMAAVAASLQKSSPEFAHAQTDLAIATAALAAAHDKGDGTAAIDAQNRKVADEQTIKEKLDAASAADPDVVKDKKDLDETSADIRHLGPVVANAAKARNTLLDGFRNPVTLQGPASASKKGVLGKIKPIKIIDEHSFTTDFDLATITGVDKGAKGPDGITMMKGTVMKIPLLVVGYDDTAKLKDHTETMIDQYYQLTGQKTVGQKTYYVAERVQPDSDQRAVEHLLAALDDLHVPAGMTYKP